MTFEIQIYEVEAQMLREQAEANGQDLPAYVGGLLRRDARRPVRSFDQIAADIAARTQTTTHTSEEDMVEILENAKHQMRGQRRGSTNP